MSNLSPVDRPWNEYPIGTKAHACFGGYWTRTERGWRWESSGSTYPTPGSGACGACIELPEEKWHAGIMPDDALPPDSFVGRMLRPSADDVTWDTPKEVRMIGARITDGQGEPIMDISFDPEPELLPLWKVMAKSYAEATESTIRDWDAVREGNAAEIEALRDWLLPEEPEPVMPPFAKWSERQRLRALLTQQARIAKGDSNG